MLGADRAAPCSHLLRGPRRNSELHARSVHSIQRREAVSVLRLARRGCSTGLHLGERGGPSGRSYLPRASRRPARAAVRKRLGVSKVRGAQVEVERRREDARALEPTPALPLSRRRSQVAHPAVDVERNRSYIQPAPCATRRRPSHRPLTATHPRPARLLPPALPPPRPPLRPRAPRPAPPARRRARVRPPPPAAP